MKNNICFNKMNILLQIGLCLCIIVTLGWATNGRTAMAQQVVAPIYALDGDAPGYWFGYAVKTIPDVNNDSVSDLLIGAPDYHLSDRPGHAYVISGLDGTTIHTFSEGGRFGSSVASAGDINQDGVGDLIIGAHGSRVVYVYSGSDDERLLTIYGANYSDDYWDTFGIAVASAGDVNGDGIPDIMIGSSYADANGIQDAGCVYVFSGVDGSLLYRVAGQEPYDFMGISLASVGDINSDGHDDFAVGAPAVPTNYYSLNRPGSVMIYSGATGEQLRRIYGMVNDDEFGWSLANVGDVNGDEKADLIIGTRPLLSLENLSKAYVYSVLDGTRLMTFTGDAPGDLFGTTVTGGQDIDGDGITDFVIGAPYASPSGVYRAGSVYAYSGGNGTLIYRLDGIRAGDNLGFALSTAGDLNGDDLSEVLVASAGESSYSEEAGGYSVTGKVTALSYTSQLALTADLSTLSVNIGDSAVNSGTIRNLNGSVISLSASIGSVVDNGNGTWSWVYDAVESSNQRVVITAIDQNNVIARTSFKVVAGCLSPDPTTRCTYINSTGGELSLQNNSAKIIVPPNSVQEMMKFSITDNGSNFELGTDLGIMFSLVSIGVEPHNVTFQQPVTVVLKWNDIDNDGIVDGTDVPEGYLYIAKDHVVISSCATSPSCDTATNAFSVYVTSFSQFDLGYLLRPQFVSLYAPAVPVPSGTVIEASATCYDFGNSSSFDFLWEWGDGTSNQYPLGQCQSVETHSYTKPGVYTISVTITNEFGLTGFATHQYIVVYDPNGGFVTGGGWINSPTGAYTANPLLTGKATFGFVSKYQKGANVPTGNTEFQFRVVDLNFKSTSYDWLVIAGTKVQYKGTGTINGGGEYKFILTAIDGSPDKFRIKIWDKATGVAIYDNQVGEMDTADPSTVLGGGSIVIHK